MDKIKNVRVENLLGQYTLDWTLNPDVNILVGINGSGKSTLLRKIDAYCNPLVRYQEPDVRIEPEIRDTSKCILIDTFDVSIAGHKIKDTQESVIDVELRNLLYATGQENQQSFVNYRLKATSSPQNAQIVNERIKSLFSLIDNLFSKTKKKIEIKPLDNSIIFRNDNNTVIELTQLSSGEKQFLIILFTVFLTEEQPFLLLMDEPEISLHIEWQRKLIDIIRKLNKNCQLIIATHSPSIFGKGWGDKLFFMEDLLKEK